MAPATISVVVPCYNAERFLAEALESALAQTRCPDEVLVVDDGSLDDSETVATRYPVRLIRTNGNLGHAAARNLGISEARGEVIAWLDADDVWERDHLEVVGGLLGRFPSASVAASGARYFGGREGSWCLSDLPALGRPANIFWRALAGTPLPAMSVLTRRDALLEVGGFDPTIRIAPDYDLWLRLSRRHLFVVTGESTARYRFHAAQISAKPLRQLEAIYQIRARFLDELRAACDPLAAEVAGVMGRLWERDVWNAYYRRDWRRTRVLIDLALLVPGADPEVVRSLRWRTRVPARVLRAFDAIDWRSLRVPADQPVCSEAHRRLRARIMQDAG
jgi:glycosyltransferase involved in cell wall biosynthesis